MIKYLLCVLLGGCLTILLEIVLIVLAAERPKDPPTKEEWKIM